MNATAMSGKPGTNRHPVDQLAQIRATQKILAEREAELKAEIGAMMGTADSLGGAEFIAIQKLQSRKGGIDEAAMKAAGIDVEKYRKPASTFIVLNVEPRVSEVA
ncbi:MULTISPECIES: hypothetical protein [unclassified Mesorhizobium]|uniref:hypothetical protein n=1 Tax=unclassified Mesorhizobium TaxID=325217 RepID=UPI00112D4F66|nr:MULTISPECIES: hypothetical protein [unclassified Mesorhizobium]TPK59059.1 hypothetical protein FJ551_25960 [Mesorhizobium sp. B2-5-1]TPL06660.1 hypothetical protein FJ944_22785 [Mesorhizobium sp. B2-4-11]